MKTELIVVGKTTNKHFIAAINDYLERIGHYMPFSVTVIPELRNAKSLSQQQQKDKEGEAILRLLQPSDTVVLLDERGKEPRSIEHAAWCSSSAVPMASRSRYTVVPTPCSASRA